jgi:DNA-binding winged helix-turn-helix (wHTH) protein
VRPLAFPPFALDAAPLRLRKGAEEVRLRRKVLAVLAYLAARPGRAIGKDELLAAVWPDAVVGEAAVKVCIRELRRALGDDAHRPAFVETLPDGAYRFVAPVEPPTVEDAAPPVVGRDDEIAELALALREALARQRRVALVRG